MAEIESTRIREKILDKIRYARIIQNYLWGSHTYTTVDSSTITGWLGIFDKRLSKIGNIDFNNEEGSKVELKKRILQLAAVAVKALEVMEEQENGAK